MSMELKDLSLDEVVDQLTKLKSMHRKADFWKLRIVLSTGQKWCVGKIIGIANDKTGEATAYMFPVPENIGSLNALSKLMTMMTCDKAAKGQECGSCPDLPTCPQMKSIDESFRRMAEGGKEKQNADK